MKSNTATSTTRARRRAGFSLAEVLAALAFMGIVIPVAVQGLRIASLAGQVGERKTTAARIAERVLNELVVTGAWQGAGQRGTIQEGVLPFRWELNISPWDNDTLQLLTVQVTFNAQGQDYNVRLSTLADSSTP